MDDLAFLELLDGHTLKLYEAMGGVIEAKKIIKMADVELEEVRYRFSVSPIGLG